MKPEQTLAVTSAFQEGVTPLTVLLPDAYTEERRWRVLYVLPVAAGVDDRMLGALRTLEVPDRYGLVVACPTMAVMPWYGDHPSDDRVRQESYLRDFLVPLLESRYATRGDREGRLLLGFSKSGWGAFSLLLRNPGVFGYAASWDAPMFAESLVYGMDAVFATVDHMKRHEPAALAAAASACSRSLLADRTRFVLAGEQLWGRLAPSPRNRSHTAEMGDVMRRAGIPVRRDDGLRFPHAWDERWMGPVVDHLVGLAEEDGHGG